MVSQLHLPSLTLKGYRGIQSLHLPNLGQITLLAGKNSIGKTTILEAIRVYASRGDASLLANILHDREELILGIDEDGDEVRIPDYPSLFYEYDPDSENNPPPKIQISSKGKPDNITVQPVDDQESDIRVSESIAFNALKINVGSKSRTFPITNFYEPIRFRRPKYLKYSRNSEGWLDPIKLESLGPGLIATNHVSRLWDAVALTKDENFVTEALRLIVGDIERLAVIGDPSEPYYVAGRRVVAKLKSSSTPIPLKRLGDGVQRLLGIALALSNCQNGILIIDEVENGMHHSIQQSLWHMIFKVAVENNIQVVAATHSWDCIANFAVVANETPAVGVLYRLEQFEDDLHAVHYSEEDLNVAAQQRIEVR